MTLPRLVGINHVALEVGDLDAALELYGRLFDFGMRGRGRGMAFVDMGDQFLAIAEGRSQEPDGGRHFGLVVDDVEAARAAVRYRRGMDGKARLVGINHVALEVSDLDAALDLYGRLFGFDLRGRVRGMAFIDMGDQFLAVAEGRSQPPDDGRHFGLVVDDVDAARAAVAREGLRVLGGRGRSFDFRDPWGNRFQVVGYRDIQFERTPGVRRKLGIEDVGKTGAARREISDRGLQ